MKKKNLPLGRAGVDLRAAVQGAEIAIADLADKINQAAQPAPKAVEFPRDKAIPFAWMRLRNHQPLPHPAANFG
jgi:hypothetical protein